MDQLSHEYFEEHAVQVARVVFAAAYLDDHVSIFLSEYLDLTELQENALLRPMGTRAKIDLFQRLTNQFLDRDDAKKMTPLFEGAKKALDERNAVVHGIPAHVDGKMAFVSWVGKNRLVGAPEEWPVERVCGLADRLISLMDAVETLVVEFRRQKTRAGGQSRG